MSKCRRRPVAWRPARKLGLRIAQVSRAFPSCALRQAVRARKRERQRGARRSVFRETIECSTEAFHLLPRSLHRAARFKGTTRFVVRLRRMQSSNASYTAPWQSRPICRVSQEPLKNRTAQRNFSREGLHPRKLHVARMQRRGSSTPSIGTKSLTQRSTPSFFEVAQELCCRTPRSSRLADVARAALAIDGSSPEQHEIVEMSFVCVGLFGSQRTFVFG